MDSYKNESTLRRLYHEEDKSLKQVGEELGCSKDTVSRWMDKFGIDKRNLSEAHRKTHATHIFEQSGYERVDSQGDYVRIHRLIAIAHGADPHEVFSGANVHHKNGVPWDNRPENLEVMEHGKHRSLHEGTLNAPWKDEEVLRYEYYNNEKTLDEMADEFGVAQQTVADWMEKFGIERRLRWDHIDKTERNESGDFV